MSTLSTRVKFLVLSGVILLAVVARLAGFVGLIGSDDLTYNHRAYEVLSGTFAPQRDHQASRLGLILPTAAAFRAFGINEIASAVFPLLCGMLSFGLVLWTGIRYLGWWTGLMAGALYALLPIDLFQATILLPDLPAASCMAASAVLMYRHSTDDSRKSAGAWLFLAGLLFGWAYLIKETSVFFGVFAAGYAVQQQWRRRQILWGWLWFAAGTLTLAGPEFMYYGWTTGSPFFRYMIVQIGHNVHLFSGGVYQGAELARRLTLDAFFLLFHVPDFSLVHVFALAGCVYSLWKRQAFVRFLSAWYICLLLLYNFASTSLTAYYPLVLFHRFFLVLSVPAVLVSAWFLQEMAQVLSTQRAPELRRLRMAVFIPVVPLAGVTILWFSWLTCAALMVWGLLVAFTVRLPRPARGRNVLDDAGQIMVIALVAVTLLPGLVLAIRGERARKGLTCERDLLPVLEAPLRHEVLTDRRTEPILEFLTQYQYEDLIQPFHDLDLTTVANVYIIANWERLFFLENMYGNRIPETLLNPPPSWRGPVRVGGSVNPCLIYQVPPTAE